MFTASFFFLKIAIFAIEGHEFLPKIAPQESDLYVDIVKLSAGMSDDESDSVFPHPFTKYYICTYF